MIVKEIARAGRHQPKATNKSKLLNFTANVIQFQGRTCLGCRTPLISHETQFCGVYRGWLS